MQPSVVKRQVVSAGVQSQESFGIHFGSEAHLLRILRSQLYSNKVLAVLREYGSNAWDEHRESGRPDVPIKVSLPTELDSTVEIQDFGRGLSEKDVYTVFVKYGASTKRDSNTAVGMLGIGAKAGFAYNDSFSVVSRYGGTKKIYSAVLDASDKGIMSRLYASTPREYAEPFAKVEGVTLPNDGDPEVGLEVFDGARRVDIASTHTGETEFDEAAAALVSSIQAMPGMWSLEGLLSANQEFFHRYGDPKVHVEPSQRDRFEDWVSHNSPDFQTGLSIKIPVVPRDISKFQHNAKTLFPFFNPVPDINMPCEPIAEDRRKHGFLTRKTLEGLDRWIAVMGCVPYRIDFNAFHDRIDEAGLRSVVDNLKGGLYFEIGEVDIAASREVLELTEKTVTAVLVRLGALHEELTKGFYDLVKAHKGTGLQLRLKLKEYADENGLPVPNDLAKLYAVGRIQLYTGAPIREKNPEGEWVFVENPDGSEKTDMPKTFRLMYRQKDYTRRKYVYRLKENRTVHVSKGLAFLIHNSPGKHSGGFTVPTLNTVWVSIRGEHTADEVREELEALLLEHRLDGARFFYTEDLEYTPGDYSDGKKSNRKHNHTVFVYNSESRYGSKGSQYWDMTDEAPGPQDPYVILRRFEPHVSNFAYRHQQLRDLSRELFGVILPPVYGIKSTERKPVGFSDVEGVPYKRWANRFITEQLQRHPQYLDRLALDDRVVLYRQIRPAYSAVEFLLKNLSHDHFIAQALQRGEEDLAYKKVPLTSAEESALDDLKTNLEGVHNLDDEAAYIEQVQKEIREKYPLLAAANYSGLQAFNDNRYRPDWLDYIQLRDRATT